MNINETLSNKNVFLNEKKTHRKPFLISHQTETNPANPTAPHERSVRDYVV